MGARADRQRSDSLGREHFEAVALLNVVVTVERNTAFEAFADLVDVVLEAPERADTAFPEFLAVAQHTHAIAAVHHAIGDDAPGDGAAAGFNRLAHLGVAVHNLLVARFEHA